MSGSVWMNVVLSDATFFSDFHTVVGNCSNDQTICFAFLNFLAILYSKIRLDYMFEHVECAETTYIMYHRRSFVIIGKRLAFHFPHHNYASARDPDRTHTWHARTHTQLSHQLTKCWCMRENSTHFMSLWSFVLFLLFRISCVTASSTGILLESTRWRRRRRQRPSLNDAASPHTNTRTCENPHMYTTHSREYICSVKSERTRQRRRTGAPAVDVSEAHLVLYTTVRTNEHYK